jgi:serine/threonine protein kinase
MEVLDEGGFGCVIRPPLNCNKGPKTPSSMVSKLQLKKYAIYEMSQLDKLKKICRKIPNCQNYAVIDVKICTPKIPKQNKNKTRCSLLEEFSESLYYISRKKRVKKKTLKLKSKIDKIKILNMPYSGVNLHRYILKHVDFKKPETFIKINNSIIDMYQNFIMILNKNNFYHNDIKTLNILVDNDERFRLIDFGISNKIVFSHQFIFNKPYMYILLSDYFLEKIEELKQKGHLIRKFVEPLILNYVTLIKINKSQDYLYTKEILEFLFPNSTSNNDTINSLLLETLIQTSLTYNTSNEWVNIYIHNLDIVSVALMYPDILCAVAMNNKVNVNFKQSITSFFTKYVLECYTKIKPEEFIADLNNLNMNVV